MIDKIVINEITYDVREFDVKVAPERMGQLNQIEGAIHLNKDLKEDIKLNTLLHEVCHAIFRAYSSGIETNKEEEITESMSNGLFSTLKRNPEFVKLFLIGNAEG